MTKDPYRHLASVFLVSAGILAYEVVLARVFALAFWHHFAGLLIALALTGFGAAGSLTVVFLPYLKNRRAPALALTALGGGGAMILGYRAALAVGLEPLALAWSERAWLDLALVTVILVVPFLLSASHVALVLAWSRSPGRAYALNLAGSGLGCLAAAAATALLLPNQAIYPAAGLTALGAFIQIKDCSQRIKTLAAALAVVLAGLFIIFPLPLHFEPFKDRSAILAAQGAKLEHRLVGLDGLVEVIGGPAFHHLPGMSLDCQAPLPPQKGMFLDGDLIGPVTGLPAGQIELEASPCLLTRLAFEVFRPKKLLVINPGGGLGFLAAGSDALEIVGVEENPKIIQLMNGPLLDFSGGLARRPGLRLLRADPAIFTAQTRERFDLVTVGHGLTWGAGSASGVGVNRLMTVEGLIGLLKTLSPDGGLAWSGPLLTPPRASIKLFALAAAALKKLDADPGQGLVLARDWNTVLLLIKPQGFSKAELDELKAAAGRRGFDLSWAPGLEAGETNRFHLLPGEPLFSAADLIVSGRGEELFRTAPFDLRPATRDRPYFFSFFRWATLRYFKSADRGFLPVTDWGLLFIWGGLAAVTVIAAAGIFPPLVKTKEFSPSPAFFSLIGLGYMLAEVTLLAEAIYLLGRPALAFPLVVGLFLVTSGLGSLVFGHRRPGPFALMSAGALVGALFGLRLFPGGAAGTVLALAPAAFVMGGPFAGGLTHLAGPRPGARAWAFGLNGFFSVIGSLVATLICLKAGHLAAILAAATCYLLAGLAARRVTP